MPFFLASLLLFVTAQPGNLTIRSVTEKGLSGSLTFYLSQPFPGPQDFSGGVWLDGAPAEIPLTGRVTSDGPVTTLQFRFSHAAVPESLLSHLRVGTFDYRLSGLAEGRAISVAGNGWWDRVTVADTAKGFLSKFFHLRDVKIEKLSLSSTRAGTSVEIFNPFHFALNVAEISYRLDANGRVIGNGHFSGAILPAAGRQEISLPVDVDNGNLLTAAGAALLSGGELDGRLSGFLTLRLPEGNVRVPFSAPARISISG